MHLLIKYLYLGGWICLTSAEEGLSWRAGLEESIHRARGGRKHRRAEDQALSLGSAHGGRRKSEMCSAQKQAEQFSRVNPGAGSREGLA